MGAAIAVCLGAGGLVGVRAASESLFVPIEPTRVLDHRFDDRRPGDVRASTADVSRARERLGWSPSHTLETGLDQTLAWYRERAAAR